MHNKKEILTNCKGNIDVLYLLYMRKSRYNINETIRWRIHPMKKQEKNITWKVADIVSKIYFAMILAFLPLYFDGKFYTAMIAAKGKFYWVIAGVMGVGILATLITSVVKKEYVLRYRDKLNAMDWAMLAFGGAVLISFLLSEKKEIAYFGTGSFYIGTLMLVTAIVFYFFVSRSITETKGLWDMIIILNVFLFLWIVLNTLSVDILEMHANISGQELMYLGTFGNINVISGYMCLLLPVLVVLFLNEKKHEMWLSLCLIMGLLSLTGIRTEGSYVGIATCAVFLVPYALKNAKRFENLLWVGLYWGVAITFYSICSVVIPERVSHGLSISGVLMKYWIGAIMIVVCGGLILWIEKKRILVSEKVLRIISRAVVVILLFVLAGFLLSAIISIAQGDGSWGSYRGDCWIGVFRLFGFYNPLQKLFGLGTTAHATDLMKLVSWDGVAAATAHNDFLEYLLSTGVVGFVAHLATWIIPIIEYNRQKKQGKEWSAAKMAYFVALMAYMGQSIVGNPYSLNVPIVYLMFTLYRNEDFK